MAIPDLSLADIVVIGFGGTALSKVRSVSFVLFGSLPSVVDSTQPMHPCLQ
jgi:hypothetical protein